MYAFNGDDAIDGSRYRYHAAVFCVAKWSLNKNMSMENKINQ